MQNPLLNLIYGFPKKGVIQQDYDPHAQEIAVIAGMRYQIAYGFGKSGDSPTLLSSSQQAITTIDSVNEFTDTANVIQVLRSDGKKVLATYCEGTEKAINLFTRGTTVLVRDSGWRTVATDGKESEKVYDIIKVCKAGKEKIIIK